MGKKSSDDLIEQFVQEWQEMLAADEIADAYEESGVAITEEELAKKAAAAIQAYYADNIRAECWNAAIGWVCSDLPEEEEEEEEPTPEPAPDRRPQFDDV